MDCQSLMALWIRGGNCDPLGKAIRVVTQGHDKSQDLLLSLLWGVKTFEDDPARRQDDARRQIFQFLPHNRGGGLDQHAWLTRFCPGAFEEGVHPRASFLFSLGYLTRHELAQTLDNGVFGHKAGRADGALGDWLQNGLGAPAFHAEHGGELGAVDVGAGKRSQVLNRLVQNARPGGVSLHLS